MIEKLFQKGIEIKSGTYYRATESSYDIYLSDCTFTDRDVYFSYTTVKVENMPVGFLLCDLHDVTLDFGGATLVFHGKITPFILDNCKNVSIINVKVDYDRPFYTQAHVLECDSKHMRVRIDDGFPYRVEDGYLFATSNTWEKKLNQNDCLLWLFDRTGEKEYPIILSLFGPKIFPNENPPMPIGQILVEEDGDDLIFHGDFPALWDENGGNNSLVFTHEIRDKCTVVAVGCENLYIENFIVIHGGAYGIMGMNSKNIYADNFSMYMDYEGNGRLVTNNADGVHLFNCKGDFVLKNSYMDGLLDDTVNVHNNYLCVVSAEKNCLTCQLGAAAIRIMCPIFAEGDRVGLFRGKTREQKAEYTIQTLYIDEDNSRIVLTLDRNIIGADVGDTLENLSGYPKILIENCVFGRFRGTMRMQSRESTVIRNCQYNNYETSVIFTGDTTYWYESGPVLDCLIENCRFRHTEHSPRIQVLSDIEFTDMEPYYHKNVNVRNCYFDAGLVAVLSHVDGFIFADNTSNGEMIVRAVSCDNIICDDGVTVIN